MAAVSRMPNVFEVFSCPDPYATKCARQGSCRAAVSPTSGDGKGELRFSRLSELVEGISQKMLTQTLRHMEHDGLITNYDVTTAHSLR